MPDYNLVGSDLSHFEIAIPHRYTALILLYAIKSVTKIVVLLWKNLLLNNDSMKVKIVGYTFKVLFHRHV
jgi:hypothetical protein